MLKVFLHSCAPGGVSAFNRLGRLDIGYDKLDAYADYKVILQQAGIGEFPPAKLKGYPRWSASIWDLVARSVCLSLWQEEVLPPVGLARRGAYTEHLTAMVEHWPDGFETGRSTVGMASIRMLRKKCHYVASFEDDILGEQHSSEFVHTPDALSPWDLLARAYAWTCHEIFRLPARPEIYTKLTVEENGQTLVPLEMVKEPARTGLSRWMLGKEVQPLECELVTGPCVRESDYVCFLRTAV